MAAARIRRFFRRILSVTALATVATVLPAVSSVPAHKVEYQSAPVIGAAQVPGENAHNRFITIRIDGQNHRLRTADAGTLLEPGSVACVSKRTLMRDHRIIYSLQPRGNCGRT
ncbi:hypothetical protein [uncultured Roseobacter sp.]|uniref:hypothetical protein n=1 Tax=uncultured Roseobacter sp. TaxID=114847 RepID=UPI0026104B00|nr:hypothetical protein [uncultured Roseobacter sp.]